ncbi:hypothetical protein Lser_V15G16135 [Lactuca serriola]
MTLYLDGVLMLFVNSCNESHHLQGMAKKRNMTRNQNCDGSSSSSWKRFNDGVAPWSDLDHNLLFLVMMQLGVIVAFSGVCKKWRSLTLGNKKIFMALTCGYLILFGGGGGGGGGGVVNLITRHELHFPCFPYNASSDVARIRGILVFSRSVSGWVFVVLRKFSRQIWFSIAGTRAWNRISSTSLAIDLHAFKGKIYTVNIRCRLCEMRLTPEPKLTLLQTKNLPQPGFLFPEFVNLGEKLYVIDRGLKDSYTVHELDFEEMKWVSSEISELGVDHRALYKRDGYFLGTVDTSRKRRCLPSYIWYFPNDCLNVNRLDE